MGRRCFVGLGIPLFAAALALPAAASEPETNDYSGAPIAGIRFEPERQPLSPEELNQLLPLKKGSAFRLEDLRTAIKRLHATGLYSGIDVEGEAKGGGVALVFKTQDRLFLGLLEVDGEIGDRPNRGQLASATRLNLGQPFGEPDLKEAVRGVRTLLEQNGFHDPVIEPEMSEDAEHRQVRLRFVVKPGERARLGAPLIAGNPVLKPDEILDASDWKGWFRWKPASQDALQRGLQRIREKYQEEGRLTASVRLEGREYDAAANTVRPKLTVEGGPQVELQTVGAKLSKKKLRRYVPVYAEGAVDNDLLVEGARNLRDYYQGQGYFDVEVDFEQKQVSEDRQDIVYIIDLGPPQKLVHIEVKGNRYFDTDTIRERMFLQPAGLIRLRHGRYSEGFARRDEGAIKSLYRANGFRDVEVKIDTIADYGGKPAEMAAVVTIEEGPQYLVSKFSAAGIEQIEREAFVPMLASREGQPFSETNVAMDRDFILRQYQAAGFNNARFDWAMAPGPEPNTIEVSYTIEEGERRFVRDVVFVGLEGTRWRLIGPTVQTSPGDPISMERLTRTQRDIYELGVFDKVEMAVQNPEGEAARKNIIYHLEKGPSWFVAGGLGAELGRIGGSDDSFESPAGATGFSPRVSLDVSRLHLWGLGHSINFKSRVSTLQKRGLVTYSAPRYRNVEGRNISVTALYDDSRDVRTFSSKRLEGSLQMSQRFSRALTALWRYSYRRVSVNESTLKIAPLLIPQLAQPVRIGMISANFADDRRDDPADSNKGMYNTLDAGIASHVLGSRRSFGRVLARNATYHPLTAHIVLARNLSFGWLAPFRLQGIDPEAAVPLPERFFGGGSTSHRGFPDNQAGERDLFTGFPLGGNALLFHNTELRFPLVGDNINGVFFHDMGNVYSRPGKISFRTSQRDLEDFDYMVHAVGFGVRYRTPVGPVRVDLAYSLNPPRFMGFEGTRQELLFNQGVRTEQRISRFQFFFSIGQTF